MALGLLPTGIRVPADWARDSPIAPLARMNAASRARRKLGVSSIEGVSRKIPPADAASTASGWRDDESSSSLRLQNVGLFRGACRTYSYDARRHSATETNSGTPR